MAFSDSRAFKQIATDNAFLESSVSLSSLRLSPGERAEIVVDFTNEDGTEINLLEISQNKNFLRINVNPLNSQITTTPASLTSLEKFTLADAVFTRVFSLSGSMGDFYINGVSMDENIINEAVPINQIEIWDVTNTMGVDHNFHIHATHFYPIERNGQVIANSEQGYKDTIYLAPNDNVKLIVKMTDYADPLNPYMYHCHFLEHEDAGMMGQFVVT